MTPTQHRQIREALAFYSDRANWTTHYPAGTSSLAMMRDPEAPEATKDRGDRARAALALMPQESAA